MEIRDKIAELEAEKLRIDQKIALLRELDGEAPKTVVQAEQRKSVAKDTIKAIERDTKVMSSRRIGNKVITEEWIGGMGAGKPSDYYGK